MDPKTASQVLLGFAQRARREHKILADTRTPTPTTPAPPITVIGAQEPVAQLLTLLGNIATNYIKTLQGGSTDVEKLARLGEFLEHPACSPATRVWIAGWKVEPDQVVATTAINRMGWRFVTITGIPLCSFTEVANFFALPPVAVKLGELVDYMEFERKLPLVLKDWTCSVNLKKNRAHHPFSYTYQSSKHFYKLSIIGDFVEKSIIHQFHRDRGNLNPTSAAAAAAGGGSLAALHNEEEEEMDELEERAEALSEAAASPPVPAPTRRSANNAAAMKSKWLRELKPGDTVLVEGKSNKNKLMAAIITQLDQAGPNLQQVADKDLSFSVYFVNERTPEHAVTAKRIHSTRKETNVDVRTWQKLQQNAATAVVSRAPAATSAPAAAAPAALTPAALAKKAQAEEQSRQFLEQVRTRIGKTLPGHYQLMVSMLQEVSLGQLSLGDLREFVLDLFADEDADLAIHFSNSFLPPDLKITPQFLRRRQVDRAALFRQAQKRARIVVETTS